MLPDEKLTFRSRLGFIGLGHLGSPIARRLVAAGFPMVVYDRDPTKTADLISLGANASSHPRILASEVDVVLSCLPDEPSVEDAYLRTGDVLHSAKPGTRIIELSTISPETSRKLHRAARQCDVSVLDVAVSGSAPAAESGALTLFGGGDRKAFGAAEPIFAAIARQWFYMGSGGSGVAMKLVVAVALGSSLGLPRDLLFDTLAKTAVVAPAHTGKLATAKNHDFTPQFPVRLMRKDFGLILAAAEQFGLSMPVTAAASEINAAEAASGIDEDFSVVIRRMELSTAVEQVVPPAA